ADHADGSQKLHSGPAGGGDMARRQRAAAAAHAATGVAIGAMLALLLLVLGALPGAAKTLQEHLAGIAPADLLPGAASFGQPEGDPPLVPLLGADGARVGWAYLNTDFTTSIGYSGKPIHIVVGIDPAGTVRGLKLVEHHEPI